MQVFEELCFELHESSSAAVLKENGNGFWKHFWRKGLRQL